MDILREVRNKHLGYKIVGWDRENDTAFSIYKPSTRYDVSIGKILTNSTGIYLGSSEQFAIGYYGDADMEQEQLLLTCEFNQDDLIRGDPDHQLDELLVRKLKIIDTRILTEHDF